MEHAQNTRTVLATAVVLVATGLAGCATASTAGTGPVVAEHRQLVRESADRYVEEQIDRARSAITHRLLMRESAERYIEELLERARAAAEQ